MPTSHRASTADVRYLYTMLVHLLRPAVFVMLLWRGLRNRHYWEGLGERLGFGAAAPASPALWVHAVSLGEVNAAAPLIRALRIRHPGFSLVLTTATPTGRARARDLFAGSVAVQYLPYDTPGAVRRFLARVAPRAGIVMETELWPNLFRECRRRGTLVLLANARMSAKSEVRYRRFSRVFRDAMAHARVAAQTASDAQRFIAVGARPENTCILGNIKFDVNVDEAALARGRELRAAQWNDRPVWIAGSTHAGEDEQVLDAHARVLCESPRTLLMLVPRHPERFDRVAELIARRDLTFTRRSSGDRLRSEIQVLLVDTMGELGALYAAADVAFVGGSLVPVGGHNLVEPAAQGLPVLTGPYQSNGQEIAQELSSRGALQTVQDAAELAAGLQRLLADDGLRQAMGRHGREIVEANRGSVERLLEWLEQLLQL